MADNNTIKAVAPPESYRSFVDSDAYSRFLHMLCKRPHLKYATFSFPAPWNDLLKESPLLNTSEDFLYYWEKPADVFAIAAAGTLKEISASGADRFDAIYACLEEIEDQTAQFTTDGINKTGVYFLGGFSFFDEANNSDWENFKASSFIIPKGMAIKDDNQTIYTVGISLHGERTPERIHQKVVKELDRFNGSARIENNNYTPAESQDTDFSFGDNHRRKWTQTVLKAKNRIEDNSLEKVVMARQLKLKKHKGQNFKQILDQLRTQYPNCSSFLIKKKHSPAFIGCSPEKLLSFHGNAIYTEALAGSIARGTNQSEDQHLENQLLNSTKNNEEHRYVVHSINQELTPFVHDLKHKEKPVIKKLANVQHLHTPIRAQKNDGLNPLFLLGKLHPTPAVGGYPREKAVDYIRQNESFNRGWFASPVGWINSNDEGEFIVAIRSGLIDETKASLFAGCGIVADSDPDKEWLETNLKFMPMLSALSYD